MPYITESVWQQVAPVAGVIDKSKAESIMLAPYPKADPSKIDQTSLVDAEWLKQVITAIRNIRGELNIGPSKAITAMLRGDDNKARFDANRQFLIKLAKLEELKYLEAGAEIPSCTTQLIGKMEVLVPMAGLIDVDAELTRLNKEIERLQKDIDRLKGKLENPNFVDKAPANVVAKEQEKLQKQLDAIQRLSQQIDELKTIS